MKIKLTDTIDAVAHDGAASIIKPIVLSSARKDLIHVVDFQLGDLVPDTAHMEFGTDLFELNLIQLSRCPHHPHPAACSNIIRPVILN